MTTRFVQLAYVARSLTEKCEQLFEAFDIGPFLVARNVELVQHRLWGKAADNIVLDVALAQSGELNIEVMELKSSGPNAMTVMFQGHNEGIQHIACFCPDLAAERDRLALLGYPPVSEFQFAGGIDICFSDTRRVFGHMVELYQDHPALHELYARVRALRSGWDGRNLFLDM
jgi:hypothetical protein